MLRKEVIFRKIALIQEDLEKLSGLAEFSLDEIVSDYLKQNTLERLLEKIIMRAVDINEHLLAEIADEKINPPKTYKQTFTELVKIRIYPEAFGEKISQSTGTRNLLVHEYDQGIDYGKLYGSLNDGLKDYHQYCTYILDFLRSQEKIG